MPMSYGKLAKAPQVQEHLEQNGPDWSWFGGGLDKDLVNFSLLECAHC